jgi:hypothetical protein
MRARDPGVTPVVIGLRLLLLLGVGGLAAAPDMLRAQTCVPRAVGVPWMGGPPRWWNVDGDARYPESPNDNAANPIELDVLGDPRWNRAVGHSDGSTANEHSQFRALVFQDTVYLSWEVNLDPGGLNPGADVLWIGIKQQGAKPAVVIQLTYNLSPSGDQVAEPRPTTLTTPVSWRLFTKGSSPLDPWPETTPVPTWLSGMSKLWTSWSGSPPARWAFQVAIPKKPLLADGLDLGSTIEMWYSASVQITRAGITPAVSAQYKWPRTMGDIGSDGSGWLDPANPWPQFLLEGVGCAADITIEPAQIGTTNAESSKIWYDLPPETNARENTFFAKPRSLRPLGAADIPAGSVSAKFYIANWGSVGDVNDVSPAGINTLWQEISPAAATFNADAIPPQATGLIGINTKWTLSKCEVYDFIPDPYPSPECDGRKKRWEHECVLVELFSGLPLVYQTKSVYRNMDVVKASRFSRPAEISVRGTRLPSPDATQLPVYLYVETVNMPRRTKRDALPAAWIPLGARDSVVRRDGRIVGPARDSVQVQKGSTAERQRVLQDLARSGQLSTRQIDSLSPTYRVHVYRETGDTVVISGVRHVIVRPQTSFGYWVTHDGELLGWKHALEGAQLTQISPDMYKLMVPANGAATITTSIEAIEPPRAALSIHAGVSRPLGDFRSTASSGFGLTADLELRIASLVSLEGLVGAHRFQSAVGSADLDLGHVSAGAKVYLSNTLVRPFVTAGGGVYKFRADEARAGGYGGAGVQLDLTTPFAIDLSYTAHGIGGSDVATTFSAWQGGMRFRF